MASSGQLLGIGIACPSVDVSAKRQTLLPAVFIIADLALQNQHLKRLAAAVINLAVRKACLSAVGKHLFQKFLPFHSAYPLPPTVILLTRIIGCPTSVG